MNHLRSEEGVSLAELLLVLSISSVIGVILVQILLQNSLLVSEQTTAVSQGLGLSEVNIILAKDIKAATGVVTSILDNSNMQGYTTDSNTLILKLNAIDSNQEIIYNVFDYIVVEPDSNNSNLLRKIVIPSVSPPSSRPASNTVILKELSLVLFEYIDSAGTGITNPANYPNTVQVNYTLTLSTDLGFTTKETSINNQVRLRND